MELTGQILCLLPTPTILRRIGDRFQIDLNLSIQKQELTTERYISDNIQKEFVAKLHD